MPRRGALDVPRNVRLCMSCLRPSSRSRRSYMATASLRSVAEESRLPRIAQPTFWSSLLPKFMRRPQSEEEAAQRARRRDAGADERRVGIIFLVLGIMVGSNAINIIALRRDMLQFTRQTNAKLDLLREVVRRVRNGEDVDVKKALGTGDPQQEKEWEEVIQELENTDTLWEGRQKRDAKRGKKAEEQSRQLEERESESLTRSESKSEESHFTSTDVSRSGKRSSPKFLM